VDVLLNGVSFTVEAALPALLAHGAGGPIVITSSVAGFKSVSPTFRTRSPGTAGYTAAKHGVVGLMRIMPPRSPRRTSALIRFTRRRSIPRKDRQRRSGSVLFRPSGARYGVGAPVAGGAARGR
jgi:hypothetical protein